MSFPQAKENKNYRVDIDGLRALAISLVIIFHFDIFSIGKAGFMGVDVFFVISGFLITGIISKALSNDTFSLSGFYYRRVRRLYPAMLTVLLLYLVAGYFFLLPDIYKELALESLLSQLYVVNFYFWQNINYFGLQSDSVPLLHTWSLAVEEQFYFIYPLFLIFCFRYFRNYILQILIIISVLSFVLGIIASGWKPQAAFYLLPTRAWELLAGGVIALILNKGWKPSASLSSLIGYLSIAMIVFALAIYDPLYPFPGWIALLPTLAAVGLLISGLDQGFIVTRFFSFSWMRLIGRISYPLYLVHWPVLILMKENLYEFSLSWRVSGLLISVLLAWLIYQYVETPLRNGKSLSSGRILTATAAVSLFSLLISFMFFQSGGASSRFPVEVNEVLAYQNDTAKIYSSCTGGDDISSPGYCKLGDSEAEPNILIFGDSHGRALAGAVDLWLTREEKQGYFAFNHGCLPLLDAGTDHCMKFVRNTLNAVKEESEITTVYIVSIWRQPIQGEFQVQGKRVAESDRATKFKEILDSTVEKLQAMGKQVVFVDPLFAAKKPVPRTIAGNIAFGRDWQIDVSIDDHYSEFKIVLDAFDEYKNSEVKRISIIDDLCATGSCQVTLNGKPVFSDNNHLAFSQMEHFSKIIEKEHARQSIMLD